MEKEGHGAAYRNMTISFSGLVEDGKDGVYGFGKSFRRVGIVEKHTGTGVIEIEGREAKLWGWKAW